MFCTDWKSCQMMKLSSSVFYLISHARVWKGFGFLFEYRALFFLLWRHTYRICRLTFQIERVNNHSCCAPVLACWTTAVSGDYERTESHAKEDSTMAGLESFCHRSVRLCDVEAQSGMINGTWLPFVIPDQAASCVCWIWNLLPPL